MPQSCEADSPSFLHYVFPYDLLKYPGRHAGFKRLGNQVVVCVSQSELGCLFPQLAKGPFKYQILLLGPANEKIIREQFGTSNQRLHK